MTAGSRPCGNRPPLSEMRCSPGACPATRWPLTSRTAPIDQEQHQRRDLDDGEPELHLAEPLHGDHVHAADEGQRHEREHPLRHVREGAPVSHVEGDGRDIDDAGHRPVQVVHPAGDEGAALAHEFAGVGHEAARCRAVHHEFAQRAQDQEREDAAEQVHQRQRRAGELQPGAGAEEQPRADGAPDGDHLHLTRLEALFVAVPLGP